MKETLSWKEADRGRDSFWRLDLAAKETPNKLTSEMKRKAHGAQNRAKRQTARWQCRFQAHSVPAPAACEAKSTGDDRELVTLYKRVIGLDFHQEQITARAQIGQPDGSTCIEQRQFAALKRGATGTGAMGGLATPG